MKSPDTAEVLRAGLSRTLDHWNTRLGGDADPLYQVLRLALARALGTDEPSTASAIDHYFDNVRYALLDPIAKTWGTLANALRVAASVDTVTERQRATFAFAAESLAAFFRAAHESRAAESLWHAFRTMPAADCQTLAALFNPNLDVALDGDTLLSIVRVLGNEGPLTSAESEALALLKSTGLVHAAFRGLRGQG